VGALFFIKVLLTFDRLQKQEPVWLEDKKNHRTPVKFSLVFGIIVVRLK
jgi:hypothetical protein